MAKFLYLRGAFHIYVIVSYVYHEHNRYRDRSGFHVVSSSLCIQVIGAYLHT